jgi:hypothetical protein
LFFFNSRLLVARTAFARDKDHGTPQVHSGIHGMAPLAFGLTSKQHNGACRRGTGGSNTLPRFRKRRHFCSHGGSITTKRD